LSWLWKNTLNHKMALIKMINASRKQTKVAMKNCINYIKKMENEVGLTAGINCSSDTAYEEFELIKKLFHKENGRLYIHMEQSFPPDANITPEKAHQIGQRLIAESAIFSGFQVVMGTHTDCAHIHNHFCINSVNADDGEKWHISARDLKEIKEKSLGLCQENDIEIWWAKKEKPNFDSDKLHTIKQGEWEKQKKGISWKYELFLAIKETVKHSHSKEEFISNLSKLGYEVQWDHHKYILFTTPSGKKCRNNKLYPTDKWTKENLLKQFEKNAEKRSETTQIKHLKEMDDTIKVVKNIMSAMKSNNTKGTSDGFPLTNLKKGLEGEALKEKMKQKENSSHEWELY